MHNPDVYVSGKTSLGSVMFRYRCSGCHRILKRRECVVLDDPWAPFGPERVCPHCESLVTLHGKPIVTGLAGKVSAPRGDLVAAVRDYRADVSAFRSPVANWMPAR